MKPKIIFSELLKAILFQIKKENAFKNFFITHNTFGIFSTASHQNTHCNSGKEKISYPTLQSVQKAAEKMEKKNNCHYSVYKCAFCTGYHIGRSRENRKE